MDSQTVRENVQTIADQFAEARTERQRRRELDTADFEQLKTAGFHLTGVLAEHGGLWESVQKSSRTICELLRVLAHGDSSVALVAAMHPTVLAFWLATPEVAAPYEAAWAEQRDYCSKTALEGQWWGTITSEPGSGGDIFNTKTLAQPNGSGYRISGQKHFGSGSGVTSFMITTAVPPGAAEPDLFFLDMRNVPWDGSSGVKLLFPWDGHGMIATQSHGMQFENFPATRVAWPGNIRSLGAAASGFIACCFTAVIVGIVETAVESARQRLQARSASMRPFEQVEWLKITQEGWLIQQAYQGMVRTLETKGSAGNYEMLIGKTAVAELAESAMSRLCKVMGGGTYGRYSPFGFWFEDVRALGFLRPPWVVAYDQMFAGAWPSS